MGVQYRKDKDGQFVMKGEAFKSKTTADGKSLYKRIHGETFNIAAGSTTACDFVLPYPHSKVEAIELINCTIGDSITLKVLDDATNTYSQAPGSYFLLNQFGFNVYMSDKYYEHTSQYDADLYLNMTIRVDYTNVSVDAKDIYINYILNEVK